MMAEFVEIAGKKIDQAEDLKAVVSAFVHLVTHDGMIMHQVYTVLYICTMKTLFLRRQPWPSQFESNPTGGLSKKMHSGEAW